MKLPNVLLHRTRFCSVLIIFFCHLGNPVTALAAETGDMRNSEKDVPAVETKGWSSRSAFLERMGVVEEYIGIFNGSAQLAGAQVTATYTCLFCGTTSASQNFQFEKGNIAGIRWGMWGENFGTALELSSTNASSMKNTNGSSASVGYTSLTVIPMLRMPFFKTDSMPNGHMNLYGGFGFNGVIGNVNVAIPGQPPISGSTRISTNSTIGTTALIGLSLKYSSLILFLERRSTATSLTYDGTVNNFSLDPASITTVPVNTNETVMGVEYRF